MLATAQSAGLSMFGNIGADVLVRVNTQSFVAYSSRGTRIALLPRLRTLSKVGQFGEWRVVVHGQVRRLQVGCVQYERPTVRFNWLTGACTEERARSK